MDATIQEAISEGQIPGAVVVVGHKGSVIFQKAYGHRALVPRREPMTLDTIFDVASLTKVVATTSAIAKLVEEGKLRLNEKVTEYIPEFQGGNSDITVRNLLTHFSGMRPDVDLEPVWAGYDTGIQLATIDVPVNVPNSRFTYSDINFVLLGEIVQRVSGKTLPEYVQAKIFKPLGMSDTMYQPPQSLTAADRADGDRQRDRQLLFAELCMIPRLVSWAGLRDMPDCSRLRRICRSSPRCCSEWGSERAFAIFSPLTVRRFTSPQGPADQPVSSRTRLGY